jgi:hypothetical protein
MLRDEKYKPSSKFAVHRLRKKLYECRQKKGESPMDYCSRLIILQTRIQILHGTCDDEDLVTQFELGCAKEYSLAFWCLNYSARKSGQVLTLEEIEKEMTHFFLLEENRIAKGGLG